MNSVLATEKGLPPGLWLPTAEESTEQYLTVNFAQRDLEPEDLIDLGSFMVALAFLDAPNSGRISMMPTTQDVKEMYEAGYGIPIRSLNRQPGGLQGLQKDLGFYPRGSTGTKPELITRFQWLYEHAYRIDCDDRQDDEIRTIDDLMLWGSARNLTPGRNRVYEAFQGDTSELRRAVNLEERDRHRRYAMLDLYKFGARVLEEHGKPIKITELNAQYPDEFIATPGETIIGYFGSYTDFWLEFDRLPLSAKLSKRQILDLGVRRLIANDGEMLITGDVNELSKEMRFPSRAPIVRLFDDLPTYFAAIKQEYDNYLKLQAELSLQGVSEETLKVACQKYQSTPEYAQWIRDHVGVLRKLSSESSAAQYVKVIMSRGFDLASEVIFELQRDDLRRSLRTAGIRRKEEIRFILELIPRISAEEFEF